ncbi:MAG: hypothetical protein Kow0099_10470 [Candidatus Abyssubacteria bacterium]
MDHGAHEPPPLVPGDRSAASPQATLWELGGIIEKGAFAASVVCFDLMGLPAVKSRL